MSAPDPHALLALAEAAARDAGALLLRLQALSRTEIATKSSVTDVVSDADRASERLIVERIRSERPRDAILGEEGVADHVVVEGDGVLWAIDPLDGTTNYFYRHPFFAVSIGVQVAGRTVGGVVHDPAHGETFTAVAGGGAFLNGEPVAVTGKSDLATALVGTGFSYVAAQRGPQGAVASRLLPHVRDIRRHGAAALDLCWVACGRLDAYYERWLGGLWDLCAGELIVREAGGVTSAIEGGPPVPASVLAASPALLEPLRALLNSE
jgi:myo-inositol-1(or 4)-monophosphatase